LVNGESLSLSGVGLTADKNVGSGKVLALNTLTLGNGSGGLASNYIFTGGTYTVDISKAELTTTLSADNKVYDATTAATVHDNGITALGMDDVSLTGSASGQFDSKHVGTGKTVSINNGYSLTGADAGNYNLVANATTSADISKAELTIDAVTDTKAYDGTTDSIRFANVKGLQGSDSIVGLTRSFDSKDVGDRILAVNAGYIFNDGANGGNYDVVTNVAKGKITAQPNTINLPLTPPPVINYPSLAPRNIEPVFNPDIEHPVSIIVYRHGDSGVVENAVVIKHEASGVSLTPSNFKSTSFTQPGDLQEKLTYTVNHNGYSAQFSISTTETGVLISPLSNEGVAITEQSREKVISLGLVALIDQQSYQVQLLRNIYIDLQK